MYDVQLIANNCEQYNGAESELTKDARVLVEFTRKALDEVRSPLNFQPFRIMFINMYISVCRALCPFGEKYFIGARARQN